MYIQDTTQGWAHTTTASLTSTPSRSSAEVITEAPCCTSSGAAWPLADFGTVSYTGSTANGVALGGGAGLEQMYIGGSENHAEDSTSPLTGGENFTNSWIRDN